MRHPPQYRGSAVILCMTSSEVSGQEVGHHIYSLVSIRKNVF